MFRDFKKGGYNLEDTNVSSERLISLILLIAIAYTSATISGQEIKRKRENKLDRERVFGMLINAMKNDKKPRAASSPEKLENASAYAPKQPGQQPTEQQLQKLREAKEKGLIRDLFDSAGDGVLKVIDRLGFAMPWYEWLELQPN